MAISGDYKLMKTHVNDIVKMMGHLNMYASQWDYNQRTYWPTVKCLDLGGTPLGQAAACALEFVPMYKKQTGFCLNRNFV